MTSKDFLTLVLKSVVINISLYVIALFLPCHSSGFISFCSGGFVQPINFFYVGLAQFGLFFSLDNIPGYIFSGDFPNIWWSIILWCIILSPFLIHFSAEYLRARDRK